jgi:hypothetical protein
VDGDNSSIECDLYFLSWTLTTFTGAGVEGASAIVNRNLGEEITYVLPNPYELTPNILYLHYYERATVTDPAISMTERFMTYKGSPSQPIRLTHASSTLMFYVDAESCHLATGNNSAIMSYDPIAIAAGNGGNAASIKNFLVTRSVRSGEGSALAALVDLNPESAILTGGDAGRGRSDPNGKGSVGAERCPACDGQRHQAQEP